MATGASRNSQTQPFDKHALLRAHPFFKDLGNTIIDRLAPRVITTRVKKGAAIFHKGDIGSKLYAVRAGAVRISAPSEQGKDAIFNLVVPGELFGEIAFLDGGQRSADAVAIDNCELMVIERRDFIPLLQDDPEVAIRALTGSGLDAARLFARAQEPDVKAKLMENTQSAVERGAFGSPTFFVGKEMFFGKEQLREVEEMVLGK